MRRSILSILFLALATKAGAAEEFVAGELLVGFQPGARGAVVDGVRRGLGATKIKAWPEIQAEHWHLPPGLGVEHAVQALSANPNVLYAEPNYLVHADVVVPDDPYRNQLWALHNTGQTGGTPDADIDALEAFQLLPGGGQVVVAVLDSGVDYSHPDLATTIHLNPGETGLDAQGRNKATNGIDDDGNGKVDDFRGWDFVNNDNNPMDDNGHGTHVTGTIAATGNNGTGVLGVAGLNPNIKIMPLKILDASGWGSLNMGVDALVYAGKFVDANAQKIVRISNNSYSSGTTKSKTVDNAIKNFKGLFVASAGNSGSTTPEYPAGYAQANIIAVAATDRFDQLAYFSNRGLWVHIAAPGADINSTVPGNGYGLKSGTSMAAPHVTGVAALVLSQNPGWSNDSIKAQLISTVDLLPGLAGNVSSGGRLNARKALGATELPPDTTAPAAVDDLAASPVSPDSVTLTWTAPGDDGSLGTAYFYDIRFSRNPISTETDFAAAGQVANELAPKTAGATESFTVENLTDDAIWYFALKTMDALGNVSDLSNLASATTPIADWFFIRLDMGQNVGNYASLGVTSLGGWAVAYDNADNSVLKCASHQAGTGFFHVETVMNGGRGASLAYKPDESEISVSHVNGAQLYFVTRSVNSGSSWTSTQIEARDVYPHETCLAFAGADPMISYYKTARRATGLCVARRSGSAWSTQLVDSGAYALYNQVAIDPASNPAIVYSADANNDGTVDTLKFARWNGTAWSVSTVEAGGFFGTVAFDPVSGQPAVAHWSAVSGQLRFRQGNGTSWTSAEIVDTANPITGCSLAFGPDGRAFLAYGAAEMRLAIRDPNSGAWTVQLIDDATNGGLRNSLKGRPLGTPGAVVYQGAADPGYQVGPDPASSTTVRLALRKTAYY